MAVKLASKAEHIWICGRNANELHRTQTQINQVNANIIVTTLLGDLTVEHERERVINSVLEQDLDLVILNAGGGDFELFSDSKWSTNQQTIDLNITATVHLTHTLLPLLKKTYAKGLRRCALVFVSSHAAFMHVPHFAVYVSAKAFMNSFALTLMQEERKQGVEFLLVCPGATATQFSERAGLPHKMLGSPKPPAEVAEMLLANIGQRRMLIVNPFDRLLYIASRILPTFIYDAIVTHTQHKLLMRALRQKEMSL